MTWFLFRRLAGVSLGLSALSLGCAAGPVPEAYQNRVFYEKDAPAGMNLSELLEKPDPALDGADKAGRSHVGVEVLGGVARFSRPEDWTIRSGSLKPEARFIEYVSPRQVVFTIYERIESPREPWQVVLDRYEEETREQGAVLLGGWVPQTTFNAQARARDVQRGVPAGKTPFVSHSREYLARSKNRIVLVQIVRTQENYGEAEAELLRVVQTLRVL